MINKLPGSRRDPSCGIVPSNTTWSQGMTFSEGNFFSLKFLMKIFPVGSKEKQQKITNLKRGLSGRGNFKDLRFTYHGPVGRISITWKLRAFYHFDKQETKGLLFVNRSFQVLFFHLWWIIDVLLTARLYQQEWRDCPKNGYCCGWSLAVDDEILVSLFRNNWIWKCANQEGSLTYWWDMLSSVCFKAASELC